VRQGGGSLSHCVIVKARAMATKMWFALLVCFFPKQIVTRNNPTSNKTKIKDIFLQLYPEKKYFKLSKSKNVDIKNMQKLFIRFCKILLYITYFLRFSKIKKRSAFSTL
jgi:hypothetical protein